MNIIFKEWRVMESYEQCGQGWSYCSLCTLDTIQTFLYFRYYTDFFVTRLIINKINKVQWVDFKLENVFVSLHSSIHSTETNC